MNLFGIGTGELLLILVIILLVMGPERLPQIARYWGRLVRTAQHFTRVWQNFSAELTRELELEEEARRKETQPRPSSPSAQPTPLSRDDGADTADESARTIAPPQVSSVGEEPATADESARTIAPPQVSSVGEEPATDAAAQMPGQNGSQIGEPGASVQSNSETEAVQPESSSSLAADSPAQEGESGEVADG